MRKCIRSVVALFAALVFSNDAYSQAALSDEAAVTALESIWHEIGIDSFFLGPVIVVQDNFGEGDHRISQTKYETIYLPAQKAGGLSIVEAKDLQDSSSWGKLLETTTQGVVAQIVVMATLDYLKNNLSEREDLLIYRIGAQSVNKVVSNEVVRKGVDDYAIVRVLYTIDWDPVAQSYYRMCGQPPTSDQKAVVLLKHDPFSERWTYVTEDDANASDDLCTDNVGKALK